MTKTVAVMLGQGFESVEAVTPIDILRRGGVSVTLVSVMGSTTVKSAQNILVQADALIEDIDLDAFDMILIPGGSEGVENLKKCAPLATALKRFMTAGRPVAAICAGPTVLSGLGLLDGHKATCYPGCDGDFPQGSYVDQAVVIDGSLITSQGPGTALAFGITVLRFLAGPEVATQVAEGMLL